MNVDELIELPANAIVYSDDAWAVARKSSDGSDKWFPDQGAWNRTTSLRSDELLDWVSDWQHMIPAPPDPATCEHDFVDECMYCGQDAHDYFNPKEQA